MSWLKKSFAASIVVSGFVTQLVVSAKDAKGKDDINNDRVQVHFVPHSHMDAGWLKTYEGYFKYSVKQIFHSVFKQLLTDPKYTYTVGDLAFFRKYYTECNEKQKDDIKMFVKNGQLEIVHGGLVSNDEATTNYADILRNFEAGHDFLREEFGLTPTIGMQLDPFGHSAVNARLMAEMGLQAMFMGRINEFDKTERESSQNMEWLWKPKFEFHNENDYQEEEEDQTAIFTHMHVTRYVPPEDFVRHAYYRNGESIPEKTDMKAGKWIEHFKWQSKIYRTNNILIYWGDDFAHYHADQTYHALDMIMDAIQKHPEGENYDLKWSSMEQYVKSVKHNAFVNDIEFNIVDGDFWAYNYQSIPDSYWTGYFTTNPDFKRIATVFSDYAQFS